MSAVSWQNRRRSLYTVCGCHGITNNNNIGTSVVAIVSWLTNER